MKKTRNTEYKIPDIKAIRSFTRLLGKLHIPSCYCNTIQTKAIYDTNDSYIGTGEFEVEAYGFGLAEAKIFVEKWFEYDNFSPMPVKPQSPPYMPYPRS